MSNLQEVRVLKMGIDVNVAGLIAPIVDGANMVVIQSADEFFAQYEQWSDETFDVILCGSGIQDLSSIEMGQVLQNQCPQTLKSYLTSESSYYEPRLLIKNGFSSAFSFPLDLNEFKREMTEKVFVSHQKEKVFRTVRVVDLAGGDQLGFETFLYLPRNKKHIRYTASNAPIAAEKIEKLRQHSMGTLHVDARDLNKFYQYNARKMKDLGRLAVSSTEAQEKLRSSVRTLFNDIFDSSVKADFDHGREQMKQCESLISNYVTNGASSNWYNKLLSALGETGDTYNHASNVSVFAALFAIGIGHARPEDLAMAGLFHDLGFAQLPLELQDKTEAELKTPDEAALYFSHVEKSLEIVKLKRIILPEAVEKAILQHHEKFSGKGFPKQLPPHRISVEAQILSFADQFDYLTGEVEGRTRLKPLEALDEIRRNGSIGPELIGQIRRVLDQEREKS